MRQAQKKKEKDKVAIVLMLAFCVIALTSIFTVKSNIDKINEDAGDILVSEGAKSDETENRVEAEKPEASAEVDVRVPVVDSQDSKSPAAAPSDFIVPVKDEAAKVSNPFSMDQLIYSVTLDQYMTHCGTDIEAPEDTQVVAAADGTVTAVYEDDRFGTSVEITHTGDMVTLYSNLANAEMVEVGDVVIQGQIIGGVGTTALFESLEPAHLHFEMIKGGTYVDPADYIDFAS